MRFNYSPTIRRTIAKKWLVVLLVTVFLIVFGRILDNKSLSQAGIVIGIGVDYREGKFVVATQSVSVTGNSSEGQSAKEYVNSSATADTIMEALDDIGRKLGLIVSLSHCNVLVLSPAALKIDHMQLLYPLVKSMSLPEQAVIISTPEDPSKLLAQPIATQDNAAFLAQATLLQNLGNDGLARVTVKDFIADSLSLSGTVRVPYTRIVKPDEQPISSSQSDTEFVEIEMTENLVISGDKSFVLQFDLAKALNLYLITDTKDKLEIVLPAGERVAFRIVDKSAKTKVNGMTVDYSADLTVSFIEAQFVNGEKTLNCASEVVLKAASALESGLAAELMKCFELSKAENTDFLLLKNKVYQRVGRTLNPDCLKDITFNATYKIEVKENS